MAPICGRNATTVSSADVFAIQDDIASAIAVALEVTAGRDACLQAGSSRVRSVATRAISPAAARRHAHAKCPGMLQASDRLGRQVRGATRELALTQLLLSINGDGALKDIADAAGAEAKCALDLDPSETGILTRCWVQSPPRATTTGLWPANISTKPSAGDQCRPTRAGRTRVCTSYHLVGCTSRSIKCSGQWSQDPLNGRVAWRSGQSVERHGTVRGQRAGGAAQSVGARREPRGGTLCDWRDVLGTGRIR